MAYTPEDIGQLFNALQFQPVGSIGAADTHLEIEGEVRVLRKGQSEPVYQASGRYTFVRVGRDEYTLLTASGDTRTFGLASYMWAADGKSVVAGMAPETRDTLSVSGKVIRVSYNIPDAA